MNKKLILFLLISLIPGIFICCYSQEKKVTVTVIDMKIGKPIDNAQVTVQTIKNSLDLTSETKNTNKKGNCTFALNFGQSFQHNIGVQKHNYYPYYSIDPSSNQSSYKTGIRSTDKEIILYLSSDSLQLIEYYSSITPHFQIDTLISMMNADKYQAKTRLCLPALNWEDIPKLMKIGNNLKKITRFPRNPVSSYDQKECCLGIVALWMIESIRISEGKPMVSPRERFPSLFPRLFTQSQKEDDRTSMEENSPEIIEKAFRTYLLWWKNSKNSGRKEACKIDPLGNSGISW